ncbi:MAG: SMP-30/gluconolactonase/LRE family protein [Verrucomicrobiae bacterium]|nr:SMP-30/gluconolactonase/LRE family protein [Verrucomicrobiae bacterium]
MDERVFITEVERVAGGFQFLEGPVWVAARQELLFSDIPANRIYRLRDGAVSVFREPSNQANGNTLDREGRLITCEHATRRVTRTEPDGTVTPLATQFEGCRLNSPNDVVCRRDGVIFFSDPPYGVESAQRELKFQGVFYLYRGVHLFARDFERPNGLCFSPDHSRLYIADTERGHVRAFDLPGPDRVFCKVERPDGMRVDSTGNLYVAAMSGVEVFSPSGAHIARLELPERPANLAFGEADRRTLFICAHTSLYRVRVAVPGAA